MSYDESLFNTCSLLVQKGMLFMIKQHQLRIETTKMEISRLRDLPTKEASDSKKLQELELDLKQEFLPYDAIIIFALSKINCSYVKEFLNKSREEHFWEWMYPSDYGEEMCYLFKIGMRDERLLERARMTILATGALGLNTSDHTNIIEFFVDSEPDSEITQKAIDYWISNWRGEESMMLSREKGIARGLSALIQYNETKYKKQIDEQKKFLISTQNEDGSFGERKHSGSNILVTAECLIALSKICELNDPVLIKGKEFLERVLEKGFETNFNPTVVALIVLTLIDLGDGPKISKSIVKKEIDKIKNQAIRSKPIFLQTSFISNTKTIYEKIAQMIKHAQEEILIMSPYLDMFHEEISDKINKNNSLSVQIITRPRNQITGPRASLAKGALDFLQIKTKNSIRISEVIHARMIIVDSSQLLVSSSDLTRDQLYDEFNAGMCTEDPESVSNAIKFFKEIYDNSKPLP